MAFNVPHWQRNVVAPFVTPMERVGSNHVGDSDNPNGPWRSVLAAGLDRTVAAETDIPVLGTPGSARNMSIQPLILSRRADLGERVG